MRKSIRGALLLAVLACSIAAKKPEPTLDPGPRPDTLEFRQKAEQALLAGFFDPSSAQFQWDHGLVGGWFKPVLQRKIPGWWTCGMVNGKNRMGGFVGFRSFVVVMNNGAVTFSGVGDGGSYDFISMQCQQAAAKGILPGPEADPVVQAAAPPEVFGLAIGLGFTYRNQSDSINVNEVSTGGLAASAGISTLMVIEKVNGLSLDGLAPETRTKLLDNAGPGTVLTVRGRGDVKMEPPAPTAKTTAGANQVRPIARRRAPK